MLIPVSKYLLTINPTSLSSALMAHLLQGLAQHWHLSASQYWQLRLLCSISLGPLLGVLCLILFTKRQVAVSGGRRVKRFIRTVSLHHSTSLPTLGSHY
jgi:hypothetical protein